MALLVVVGNPGKWNSMFFSQKMEPLLTRPSHHKHTDDMMVISTESTWLQVPHQGISHAEK